ncbi:MAG: PEP-utilizing enzyme [Patescibacteria group bacterium]
MTKKFNLPLVVNPKKDLFRWKVDAYPALIYAVCRDMNKSPYGWPKSECFFFGHDFYWYNNWSDIWANGNKFIKKYLINSQGKLPSNLMLKYKRAFESLSQETRRVSKIDLNRLNLEELRREWFKFFKVYSNFWFIITDVEVLTYAVSNHLEKIIKQNKVLLSPEELSQLSAFPEKSYMLEEEYALLKIALETNSVYRAQLLNQHINKFSWILNGYHGVRLADKKFFSERLNKLIKDKKTSERYYYFQNYHREITKRFNQLVKKYKLNAEIIKYAKLVQTSSYIQDKRKALAWHITGQIIKMYEALAKSLDISLEESLYILWDEFDWAMKSSELKKEIKKRQVYSRLCIMGDDVAISTERVKEIFTIFEKEYTKSLDKEVKGVVAYPGRITGRVQIILNGQKINSFKAGRILVALMTSPDYVIAMKKAKAIITDDGGLTCHAAIVARELKKPCIVGAKNATKRLHDGDWVEVDANKGIVKIIKKSND